MNNDYNYEFEHDIQYCYENSNVLRNKLNIRDAKVLASAEREITALRIVDAKINTINGDFDLNHLCKIHQYIFSDIYEWAGQIRWVNISKGNFFCNYEYIEAQANKLFEELALENHLKSTSSEKLPYRLAYYLGEINVLHPFRDGNGRAQRLFIEYLAQSCGYKVDFSTVTRDEMVEASVEAFLKDYNKMNQMFLRIISKI